VADWFTAWHGAWQCPCEVFAAVLFHDAVYVATEGDNEARSVELAREALAGTDVDVNLVACLIEGTALSSAPPAREAGSDLALFIDCDRSVLGAPREMYTRYARAIAEEYSVLPPRVYQAGRRAFLERTLRSGVPFLTPGMQERLGLQARENLEWELDTLAH
jgi:predicted metal-dependent HD superfamily phosphohydrolase